MARFSLREFTQPDYRGSLPAHDPNNAIWPRISAFAKMLHDMSWDEDPDEDTDKEPDEPEKETQEELDDSPVDMGGYRPLDSIESKMGGYHPMTKGEYADSKAEEQKEQSNSPDMDRQRELAESGANSLDDFLTGFDPKTASKEDIRQMQRIVAPAGAKLSNPSDAPSRGYFDDASWGRASQKAFEEYMKMRGL